MNKYIIYGILVLLFGQALIWFQTNGQFLWDVWKRNPGWVSLLGWPVSYLMIFGTKWFYQGFDGVLWPGRLIGFACGMIIFGFLTYWLMNEPMSPKTIISLSLASIIVAIQVFF